MASVSNSDVSTGFSLRRSAPRFVPSQLVTVVVLKEDVAFARGSIENLSESGMCLRADTPPIRVKSLRVKVNFYGNTPLEVGARVAWSSSRAKYAQNHQSKPFHGIEFVDLSEADTESLRKTLRSNAFTLSV